MFASWFPTLPFVAPLFVKCGQVLATEDNGVRLLENEELVSVFPEGIKGVGKLYKDRYQLVRFGRGGFIRMALKTQSPILPVAVVGAEETYISIAKSDVMAKADRLSVLSNYADLSVAGSAGRYPDADEVVHRHRRTHSDGRLRP